MEAARLTRRSAKGKLTRALRTANSLIEDRRTRGEVTRAQHLMRMAYDELSAKHESYCDLLSDDMQYDEAEEWMEECRAAVFSTKVAITDYLGSDPSKGDLTFDGNEGEQLRDIHTSPRPGGSQDSPDVNTSHVENKSSDITILTGGETESRGTKGQANQDSSIHGAVPAATQPINNGLANPISKLKKDFIPKFDGNVRDYGIFRADFKHVVEKTCDERDAITVLRSSVSGKPAELIRGITNDYKEAWAYLDSVYGDDRYVADAVTHDISSFKCLKEGEDARFCEFVHLLRRSYATLKELDRAEDMNNNHILALVEQKMCNEDRKVWSRHLVQMEKRATFEHLLTWMKKEMEARMRSSAPLRNAVQSNTVHNIVAETCDHHPEEPRHQAEPQSRRDHKCWICKSSDHWIDQCEKLLAMSPEERLQKIKDNHACFSCLKRAGKSHTTATCYRRRRCTAMNGTERCTSYHHSLLHGASSNSTVGVASLSSTSAILPVVSVRALGPRAGTAVVNALIDSGAQISLIRADLATELGLKGRHVAITLSKVGGELEEMHTKEYIVRVQSLESNKTYNVKVIAIPCINDDVSELVGLNDMLKGLQLGKSQFNRERGPVDILIGIDHSHLHIGETRQGAGGIVARHSPLGWILFGSGTESPSINTVLHISADKPVDMTDFWRTESMGVVVKDCKCDADIQSRTEYEEEKIIKENCIKMGEQWQIAYPWKRDPHDLPNNKQQVLKKMESTEKKLRNNEHHAQVYNAQIKEMEDMLFSRKLSQHEIDNYEGPIHYIAHHAVLRPDNKSTPVRIVFNTSATYKGHTLNDYWYKGPDLLNNMFGVLIRFRENGIAVCADISKMYHRILIPEVDQHVHRFLWRDMEVNREPDVYVKTVLTFGDRPAPAMAQIALRKTAEEKEETHPQAARTLLKNVYMDDICESVDTLEEACNLKTDIDDVLASGGFKVKSWITADSKDNKKDGDLTPDDTEFEKILGIKWYPSTDDISFVVNVDLCKVDDFTDVILTKRIILSNIARVFDPIGFASAFLIKAKVGMQKLWQRGLDWDEELPSDLRPEWIEFFKEMTELSSVTFARSMKPSTALGKPSLCVFSDASKDAFGTCAYTRWRLSNGYYAIRFIAAKSRVAPLKELSIPRLELQAAVLAVRLYKTIAEECRFNFDSVHFFTDSAIVLHWIKDQSKRYKAFVSVRIGEIQNTSNPCSWRHIPGEVNVADDVSRGLRPRDLQGRWKNGPPFIALPIEQWPESAVNPIDSNVDKEFKRVVDAVVVSAECVIDATSFSDWKILVRVTAMVFRVCHNAKKNTNNKRIGQLVRAELEEAEMYWIRQAQRGLEDRLKKGDFKGLSPFVDPLGIIRVGGRVSKSIVSYDAKHPVLLPNTHWISTLITRYHHETGHYGVATTVARIQANYWIVKSHNLARNVKFRCVTCRKLEAKTESQIMADLPTQRLAACTPAFYYTAVDYFGPYTVKIGRSKHTKHYGVVFTCLNTRAVHLEMATDCSTQEFLQTLRRFCSIRGQPAQIMSDNGTQFVGAEKELRAMIRGWDNETLRKFCADRKIEWQFTTPLARHHNGCAESMVKSCKRALKLAMGDAVLTPMELCTCLYEVANLVNQRPIGRLPNDPDDGSYLSPNHMLLGRSTPEAPQGPFRTTANPRHRVEFVQKIVDSFWKRWARDSFPSLVVKKKWHVEKRNLRVDDVVIVSDANPIRGHWSIGRITTVYPGSDDKVRSVKVKTATGEYTRPITKVVVLHPAEGYSDTSDNATISAPENVPMNSA